MKTKFFCMLFACFMMTSIFSQSNLNSYKYIIIVKKFDFLKEPNQYRLNELAQFLFDKNGFEAVVEGEEYPEDLIRNRCLGLKADVLKDTGMFKTKLNVELKDCNDKLVFTSEVGESREKEYDKAYTEALRNAFNSIEALEYKYESSNTANAAVSQEVAASSEVAKEIQELKQEVQALREKKSQEINEQVKKMPNTVRGDERSKPKFPVEKLATKYGILYAQAIENGYQLVDDTPSLVYKIKKTGIENVFLVENKNATLYLKDGKWILEYYENNVLKQDVLNIKF